jgi:membrane protease YdiL (CAAX protease family)
MTFFAWLGSLLVGGPTPGVIWTVIVVSGALFGLGHLPSYRLAGCQVTPMLLALTIVLNLWAALICGWLFWRYGLLAAMIAHVLYHLVWLPFDLYVAERSLPYPTGQEGDVGCTP